VLAPENVKRGDAQHQKAARAKNPREFPERATLFSARQMNQHIQGDNRVKRTLAKRKSCNVSLNRIHAVTSWRSCHCFPGEINGKRPTSVPLRKQAGRIPGAGPSFEHPCNRTASSESI
jgi:hypothetical protein